MMEPEVRFAQLCRELGPERAREAFRECSEPGCARYVDHVARGVNHADVNGRSWPVRSVCVASCGDCSWQGRRQWPSPTKPCPSCGSSFIGRLIPKPKGTRGKSHERMADWESTSA